jgi:predicted NBD/HSP70 family sugar kinase
MRAHNERLVLSLIRTNGPMAKAEIARATGLSAQTISVMMRRLELDGLLAKGEPIRGRVGQPSVPMHLAPEGAYFFGLKIGRRSVDLILIDFVGTVLGRMHLTYLYPTPDGILRFTITAMNELAGRLSADAVGRIAGLGVAIPFRMWDWAISIDAPAEDMEAWKERDIQSELAERVDFPVYLRNDASAACGAELVFGEQPRPQDFLHFFIGYFVGGGLVLNGRLYTGRTGNAAALGPLPVPGPNGTHLPLMDVASLSVLQNAMRAEGQPTNALWNPPEAWTVRSDIIDTWIRETCAGLAYAIVAACSIVDLEAVLIDGWVPSEVRARLVKETRSALLDLDMSGIEKPEIREGSIGPDGRSLGAASLPLSARYMLDPGALMATG